jgi:N,N'-diacetylbacillosaminyl-diphospho-undecaprenol alpha-1,3-N-acetylgalactosaminyltransferase
MQKTQKKKIAFLSSLDLNLYLFRLDIMKNLIQQNYQVYAIIPRGEYFEKIEQENIITVEYNLNRGSLNPFSAIKSILELAKILKNLEIDLLHTFTVKPNIFGTIAGKIAKTPTVLNLIEGLGSFYVEDNLKNKIIRFIIESLYKFTIKFSDLVVFVNNDDPKYLNNKKIITQNKIKIIKSVGVDTSYFSQEKVSQETKIKLKNSLNISENYKIVIMIGRAILHKGVKDFYKSAEILNKNCDEKIIFLYVGDIDKGNSYSMNSEFMSSNKNVKWLGHRNDIRELIAISDIVVLPSYREGVPRTLLEACAMSKPIVATDVVGCREAVDNTKNGFLIPIESPQILSDKIKTIIKNNDLQKQMSDYSRQKALKEFEITKITKEYLEIYKHYLE